MGLTDARGLKSAFTNRLEAMVFSADTGSGAQGAQSSNLGVLFKPMWGFKGFQMESPPNNLLPYTSCTGGVSE